MDYEQLFMTAAIAASVAFAAPAAKAQDLPDDLEARVRAVAEQGPDALRLFVWRTRMIYALRFADYAVGDDDWRDADPSGGFWAGLPGDDAEPAAWIEAAVYPLDQAGPTLARE